MKRITYLLLLFITITILITGCKEENDENPNPEPEVLSCSTINSDLTLVNRGSSPDYIVPCRIIVEARLTIEPGVEIAFGSDAGFEFRSSGTLVSQGTSANPIIMRGEEPVSGYWRGIRFSGSNNPNKIHFTTINGAGNSSWDGANVRANISLSGNSKVEIINSVITNSASDGIHVANLNNHPDALAGFEGNTLSGNNNFPLRVAVRHIKDLCANNFPSNGINKIEVHTANHNNGILGNHSWTYPGAPILINSLLDIAVGSNSASLTIGEGMIIEMGSDMSIVVNGQGSLTINGTASNPVVIRGEQSVKDYWRGIYILSNDVGNVFNYTMISDGGSSSHSGYAGRDCVRVGTSFSGPYRLTMNNCSLSNSNHCGVRVSSNPNVGNFTDNNTIYSDLGQDVCDF